MNSTNDEHVYVWPGASVLRKITLFIMYLNKSITNTIDSRLLRNLPRAFNDYLALRFARAVRFERCLQWAFQFYRFRTFRCACGWIIDDIRSR